MNRLSYRGTSFNLPSNKKLWTVCGELDSISELQECARRKFMMLYDEKKVSNPEITFSDFTKEQAAVTGVHLGEFKVQNYEDRLFSSYLIYPFSVFDTFLDEFVSDLKKLNITLKVGKKASKTEKLTQILNQLRGRGIKPVIEPFKMDLFDYYRIRRNVVAHNLPSSKYKTAFTKVYTHRSDILSIYPNQANALDKSMSMSYDDFIVCTANLKNISDLLTIAVGKNVNWEKVGKSRPSWMDYKQLKTMHFETEKKIGHIRTTVRSLYGVSLTDKECKAFI